MPETDRYEDQQPKFEPREVIAKAKWDALPAGAIVRLPDGSLREKQHNTWAHKVHDWMSRDGTNRRLETTTDRAFDIPSKEELDVIVLPEDSTFVQDHKNFLISQHANPGTERIHSPMSEKDKESQEFWKGDRAQHLQEQRYKLAGVLAQSPFSLEHLQDLKALKMRYKDAPNSCLFLYGAGQQLMIKNGDTSRAIGDYQAPDSYHAQGTSMSSIDYEIDPDKEVLVVELPSDKKINEMEEEAISRFSILDSHDASIEQVRDAYKAYRKQVQKLRKELSA
ncbi:MAG: hypothetical protein ABIH58_03180 [Patescibacteria group bacterium]